MAGELFTEALVCKLYIPGVNQEKADALMARILDMQDSYIVRAGHPDGNDNQGSRTELLSQIKRGLAKRG